MAGGRRIWTSDLAEDTGATKTTLCVQSISPAAQLTHVAALVPEERHHWLSSLGPRALVMWRRLKLRAWHGLERPGAAEATLLVDTISLATQHPLATLGIPEVRHRWCLLELTDVRGGTMDIREATATAPAAMHMLPIGEATMLAQDASGIPIIRRLWLRCEGTSYLRWLLSIFGAWDSCEGEIAAEAALDMDPVCPTTKLTDLALRVPVVGDERVVWELATARWARNAHEVPTTAQTALHMLSITVTTEVAHLASRIPEMAGTGRLVVELTLPTGPVRNRR